MELIGNGKMITRDAALPYLENGCAAVSDGLIVEIGPTDILRKKHADAGFIDAAGGVIMPGFINAHSHIYSALARGLSIRGHNPANFHEILDGMWWKLDRKLTLACTRQSAYTTYLDCIKNGVTTLFDHHASYGAIQGSLFEIAAVAKTLGVRTCLCYEVSDRDGAEKCGEAIAENADFIAYAEKENSDMLKAMFGLHAAFTLSDDTLSRCVQANAGRTGFHIHVAEGMDDVYDSLRRYGKRTVNRLLDMGILGEKTILGHCIHINPAEMEIIKETGGMVVNNPESNMGNAVGCSPVLQMIGRGILVGLGTDAYTNDMLESLKAALAIQRHNACLPNVGWNEVCAMLFSNNPKFCERYFRAPLGALRPGAAADIIVMDYKPFTPFSADNIDGHMLFGMSGRQCQSTMIGGRLLMRERELIGIDEERINAETRAQSEKLWQSLNG